MIVYLELLKQWLYIRTVNTMIVHLGLQPQWLNYTMIIYVGLLLQLLNNTIIIYFGLLLKLLNNTMIIYLELLIQRLYIKDWWYRCWLYNPYGGCRSASIRGVGEGRKRGELTLHMHGGTCFKHLFLVYFWNFFRWDYINCSHGF